jgi:hypothetical protein
MDGYVNTAHVIEIMPGEPRENTVLHLVNGKTAVAPEYIGTLAHSPGIDRTPDDVASDDDDADLPF